MRLYFSGSVEKFMKRYLKLAILPLGLFAIIAALIWVPSLRVSFAEMKSRAALNLNFGDSRAQVRTFLHNQHMRMEATSSQTTEANTTKGEKWIVKAQPLLAPPIYFRFDFSRDKLVSWTIASQPGELGGDLTGGAVAL